MAEIYLITKNKGKLLAANKIFSKFGIIVKSIDREYPEIQADTSAEVAKYMAEQASKDFGVTVVREDHSLFITALSGFPGPYTNYFDRKISAEKLLELMKSAKDRSAFMELSAALAVPGKETKIFTYRVPLNISLEARGFEGSNWDRVMMLSDENKTFAEGGSDDRTEVWSKNYEAIAKIL